MEVQRLAVRYINVINLPPGVDFDLYLTAGPRVPPEVPQALSGFLHRVVIPIAIDGTTAIVTQVLEPPKEGLIPVVLDIDVFIMARYGAKSQEIWTTLDGLRKVKNDIFFSSVTEKALEPYK